MLEPKLKHTPEEFLVRENIILALGERSSSGFEYLTLRKCGYTTMEVVGKVAQTIGVPAHQVAYAGLKDEDGITEQLISVPNGTRARHLRFEEAGRWAKLRHHGFGSAPLKIGQLEGNSFLVTIRNLSEAEAQRLDGHRQIDLLFLNYYDTQRFGVPGAPKITHRLGGAIFDGDYAQALALLVESRVPESAGAAAWMGTPADFFAQLDPRVVAFYLCAYESYFFNERMRQLVVEASRGECDTVTVEGIEYTYARSMDAITAAMACSRQIALNKYRSISGSAPVRSDSVRSTVVQTFVTLCGRPEADDAYAGRYRVQACFSLPSGAYATAAMRQLLHFRNWR